MKTEILLAIPALSLLSAAALGQDHTTYVAGQVGTRAVESFDGDMSGLPVDGELGNGSFFSGAVGVDRGVWRFEAELARRGGSLNAFNINGADIGATGDGLTATSLMANTYIDFAPEARLSPYLGAGAGMARITADISGTGGRIDGDATALAFQLIGGASMALSETTSVFADLRYLRAMETDHTLTAPLGSSDVSFQYDGYTLGVGLRVDF